MYLQLIQKYKRPKTGSERKVKREALLQPNRIDNYYGQNKFKRSYDYFMHLMKIMKFSLS